MKDSLSHPDHNNLGQDTLNKEHSRRAIRTIIFQMLYALESFDYSVTVQDLALRFNHGFDQSIPLDGEAVHVVAAISNQRDQLDAFLIPLFSNWRAERIGCCTRLILRMALWEMQSTENPSTIIMNEAIELAKTFAEKDAHRFVNGVLDQAVKKLGRTF
jgi:transcription antitermination factor NusB